MNKDYKPTREMQILSDRYWKTKLLLESVLNGDRKDKELITNNINVEDMNKLADFVQDCEDTGVPLIGMVRN